VPTKANAFALRPRLRVQRGKEIALGPGKVELLEFIRATGSIAEAAKQMDMSYMRAWSLVKTMEKCFHARLVTVERGGTARGGARLTAMGERAIELYRRMERESIKATVDAWRELRELLRS
jgi:molybdate transport system regulatory protein